MACSVVALWDLARELEVLQRVVLDVDGEVILLGVGRDALGHGPGHTDAILLQPEVPVQPPRVVLLDDKARRPGAFLGHPSAGFRSLLEISFGLVIGELPGH